MGVPYVGVLYAGVLVATLMEGVGLQPNTLPRPVRDRLPNPTRG